MLGPLDVFGAELCNGCFSPIDFDRWDRCGRCARCEQALQTEAVREATETTTHPAASVPTRGGQLELPGMPAGKETKAARSAARRRAA